MIEIDFRTEALHEADHKDTYLVYHIARSLHGHGLIDNFECSFSISDSEDIHTYDDDTDLH